MSEKLFTPFVGRGRTLRAHMMLSDEDKARFDRLPKDGMHRESIQVFDTVSQSRYAVRRADCGANCFCAAEIVTGGC